MTDESSYIKSVWDDQGIKYGESHLASWGDIEMISLEVDEVSSRIAKGLHILDVGCANGFTTKMIADRCKPSKLYAIDFSEPMIQTATKTLKNAAPSVEVFVIINLPTWELQLKAISECLRVVKPGGQVILSEGFWEPLSKLNALRILMGLDLLVEHDFNRYIKRERLRDWLNSKNLRFDITDFSSVYYLGSRIVRELATDFTKFEGYSNPINAEFAQLARKYKTCGDIGVQQLVVISKD
jgi:2-polyprenyl-3-methyl-5-hydroxy-6-metoxy-1,4-benzoquinol methylase